MFSIFNGPFRHLGKAHRRANGGKKIEIWERECLPSVTRLMDHRAAFKVHFGQFISIFCNANLKPIDFVVFSLLFLKALWQLFTRIMSAIYQKIFLSPDSFPNCQCGLFNFLMLLNSNT